MWTPPLPHTHTHPTHILCWAYAQAYEFFIQQGATVDEEAWELDTRPCLAKRQ